MKIVVPERWYMAFWTVLGIVFLALIAIGLFLVWRRL
jgi:hypothetical protein